MEDEPPSAVKPPPRSADLQPVARICNPHAAESSEAPGVSEHPAECNSTVQQTASLRYEPGTRTRPVLGLTMGDPAGVGPELCLRALAEPSVLDVCVPVLFGDVGVLRLAAETCARLAAVPAAATSQTQVPGECETCSAGDVTAAGTAARRAGMHTIGSGDFRILSLAEWQRCGPVTEFTVVDCAAVDAAIVLPGRVAAGCGRAAVAYIEHAIKAALAGKIAGVVTAPINKEALHLAGVPHPGHTEIFAALTGARRSCMMLRSDVLTVSMVTTHIGFTDVPKQLSVERVLDVIELTAEAMQRMLGRAARLAICGLNPHAGEHGLFGQREEERFIEPAVAQARQRGIAVEGPLPPDAAFTTNIRKNYDAIVTLYHDQGHIPFKMLAFDTGVNVTLGLPIIRTSVDHGTAFDIAWKGLASPTSLLAAVRVAASLAAGVKPEAAQA